jgi:hypothetical protein
LETRFGFNLIDVARVENLLASIPPFQRTSTQVKDIKNGHSYSIEEVIAKPSVAIASTGVTAGTRELA